MELNGQVLLRLGINFEIDSMLQLLKDGYRRDFLVTYFKRF